jgi:HEAT repeat protein
MLRLEPATAARTPALVHGEPAEGGKVLVDALSTAGTDEAQAALAAIAGDPGVSPTLRTYAIQYLGLQRSPAPAAVTGLRALLDDRNHDLAQSALLALGACARSLRATAPDRTRELVGELHTRLGRATDAKSRQDLVVALGNAGDPSSLPVLRGLIESKDDKGDSARTPAIEALRLIADPAVDPLLGALLGRAGDTSARFAAISAIRFRDVGPFTAQLAEVARHDPAVHVRRAAIDLLGSHLRDLPTLLPLLEELAHGDPDPRNRELATRYLGRG